jgi:hypothetical protein
MHKRVHLVLSRLARIAACPGDFTNNDTESGSKVLVWKMSGCREDRDLCWGMRSAADNGAIILTSIWQIQQVIGMGKYEN